MALSSSRKIILASALLVAAVGAILLKTTPAPVKTAVADRPAESEAEIHPELDSIESQSTPESEARLTALEELAARDPKQALAELEGVQDPTLRALALSSVATGWARVDPLAAAKWVAALQPQGQATDAALGLISVWAASAPAACLDWASHLPAGDLREAALVELADAWSSADPQEAFSRFLGLESDDGSEQGLQSIVSQWALDAPQTAAESLGKIEDATRRDELLQTALTGLASQDPELTWKYADRFADPETIEQVRGLALESLAETKPQDAIKLAESGGNGEFLIASIARGWAVADDTAAKAWIATLADQDLAARLLDELSGEP